MGDRRDLMAFFDPADVPVVEDPNYHVRLFACTLCGGLVAPVRKAAMLHLKSIHDLEP